VFISSNYFQFLFLFSIAIKLYLACANVSQLLTLFGENTEENAKRIKYSKWKAVTIAKEVKEGVWPKTQARDDENHNDNSAEDDELFAGYPPPPSSAGNNQNHEYSDFSSTKFEPGESRIPPEPKPRGSIASAPAPTEEPELDFGKCSPNKIVCSVFNLNFQSQFKSDRQ